MSEQSTLPNSAEGGSELRFGHFMVRKRPDGSPWELGRGGMGVTYRAFDEKLHIEAALKVIKGRSADRGDHRLPDVEQNALRRFQREARAQARLRDVPYVASIYSLDEDRDRREWYIAMEFIEGCTLHALLAANSGSLPTNEALALMAQAAQGLAAAHAEGIVHRDLKPSNMMIVEGASLKHRDERTAGAGGRLLKIIDFGLAKAFGDDLDLDLGSMVSLTPGFCGTPHYSSPEQFQEQALDGRSDLYSLGIILWELLTGRRPFEARSFAEFSKLHIENEPPMERLLALPRAVQELVAGLLEKSPGDRVPQTAGELSVLLDRLWREVSIDEASTVRASGKIPKPPRFARPKGERAGQIEANTSPLPRVSAQKPAPRDARRRKGTLAVIATAVVLIGATVLHLRDRPSTLSGQKASNPPGTPSVAQPPEPPAVSLAQDFGSISKVHPYVNALGMEFLPVPISGGPTDTASHGVKLFFAATDTTVGQYGKFATARGREWPKPDFEQRPDHPAVNVSWEDAVEFCEWLTAQDGGRLPSGAKYRLPSDHEWGCAAGFGKTEPVGVSPKEDSGKRTGYPWGPTWPPPKDWGNCGENSTHDGHDHTSPVKAFPPNAFGLFDMGGNVWQWCADRYDPSDRNPNAFRVLRGASWNTSDESRLRSSYRFFGIPAGREGDIGFRCVLVVSSGA